MKHNAVDILIIGAGPSGAVAAAYLQKQNTRIRVIEKSTFPRFVVGESLLPRCMDHFDEVDFIPCLKDKKFQVKTGARFLKDDKVCEFDFSKKFTPGWDWTWQVPRAEFDKTLTDELLNRGVTIGFEQEVIAVEFDEQGHSQTTIKHQNGSLEIVNARFIIDASGHGRVLPRLLGLDTPSNIPKHSSLFTHVKDIRRPKNYDGTRITFDVVSKDTWLWVIPFSNGYTSIGYVGPTEYLESFEGSKAEILEKMMALSTYYYKRFETLSYEFEPILLKNVAKSVTQLHGKGFALTGNSAEFLDPVFSSGVTFATESGLLAAKLAHNQLQGLPVDWDLDYRDYILAGVNVFSTYVKEWYSGNLQKIFFHSPVNPKVKSQICAVLAGYVWDKDNPFVKNHQRLVKTVADYIDIENGQFIP